LHRFPRDAALKVVSQPKKYLKQPEASEDPLTIRVREFYPRDPENNNQFEHLVHVYSGTRKLCPAPNSHRFANRKFIAEPTVSKVAEEKQIFTVLDVPSVDRGTV
jgi:hypothetical protein